LNKRLEKRGADIHHDRSSNYQIFEPGQQVQTDPGDCGFRVSVVNQDDTIVQRGRKALLLSKVPLEAISASAAVETRE
jgi:hypothetical protein